MGAFPARHLVPVLAAAALLAVAGGAPAGAADRATAVQLAQGGAPPVRLGPRRPPPQPQSQPEPPAAQPLPPELPPPAAGPAPLVLPDVNVQTLSEIDPESTGVLDDASGGLGTDLWRGTDRQTAVQLLGLLPKRVSSPAMRDLMRRLLLTRATAPAARGGRVSPEAEGALLARRVEALFAIGEFEGMLRLLRTAAPERAGEALVEREVEALFFGNDNAGACRQVRGRAQGFTSIYWQQATAYCLALAGENAKAALVSELLAERGSEVSPAFFAMMDTVTGARTGAVRSMPDPLALHLSMMRAANLRLPEDVTKSARAAVLRTVALSPNADFAVRLDAAEGAFAAGVLSAEQLLEIYANVPFEPGELAHPLSAADAAWGPRGRALLMRAASLHDVPTARAEVLQRAWQLGREKGGHSIAMAAAVPLLMQVKPAGELMWFARDAARALFAAGRVEDALAWYALARQEEGSNSAAAETAIALWPLAALAGGEGATAEPDASFARWWAARPKDADAAQQGLRAQRLLALLDASGIVIDPASWASVVSAAPRVTAAGPGPAILHLLGRAAAASRRGEGVALALIAMGEDGPAASALAVESALRALRAAGLQKEARAIALEAAVAAGL